MNAIAKLARSTADASKEATKGSSEKIPGLPTGSADGNI
jgi:hypothetical protein